MVFELCLFLVPGSPGTGSPSWVSLVGSDRGGLWKLGRLEECHRVIAFGTFEGHKLWNKRVMMFHYRRAKIKYLGCF